jgi:hypothetical protein
MPTIKDVMNRNKQLHRMVLEVKTDVAELTERVNKQLYEMLLAQTMLLEEFISRVEKLEGSMKRVPIAGTTVDKPAKKKYVRKKVTKK